MSRHFALIDAAGKVVRRIPLSDELAREPLRTYYEARVRREFGVDDVTLFLRDERLDGLP